MEDIVRDFPCGQTFDAPLYRAAAPFLAGQRIVMPHDGQYIPATGQAPEYFMGIAARDVAVGDVIPLASYFPADSPLRALVQSTPSVMPPSDATLNNSVSGPFPSVEPPPSALPSGSICEQCFDAPAVALTAAPWGGEMGICLGCQRNAAGLMIDTAASVYLSFDAQGYVTITPEPVDMRSEPFAPDAIIFERDTPRVRMRSGKLYTLRSTPDGWQCVEEAPTFVDPAMS